MKYTEIREFESRAKLMVSGEYLVLKGALSLALPLKYGQKLTVKALAGEPKILWQSMVKGSPWFSATIQLPHFNVINSGMPEVSETLFRILKAASELNPGFLKCQQEYRITSEMDFDPGWGIGSSSSLISNIAYWAHCDPFVLNRIIFQGSGYDIACARSTDPIIYATKENTPSYRIADFHPHFHRYLYFVYLNRKKNTLQGIRGMDLGSVSSWDTDAISALTLGLEKAEDLTSFRSMMDQHEEITGRIIRTTPVTQLLFSDFPASVKSPGTWVGDFILAASEEPESFVHNYFIRKNLTTILNFREVVPDNEVNEADSQETGNEECTLLVQND